MKSEIRFLFLFLFKFVFGRCDGRVKTCLYILDRHRNSCSLWPIKDLHSEGSIWEGSLKEDNLNGRGLNIHYQSPHSKWAHSYTHWRIGEIKFNLISYPRKHYRQRKFFATLQAALFERTTSIWSEFYFRIILDADKRLNPMKQRSKQMTGIWLPQFEILISDSAGWSILCPSKGRFMMLCWQLTESDPFCLRVFCRSKIGSYL